MHQRTFLSWFTHMALLRGGTEWNCSNLLCKHSRAVWRCVCVCTSPHEAKPERYLTIHRSLMRTRQAAPHPFPTQHHPVLLCVSSLYVSISLAQPQVPLCFDVSQLHLLRLSGLQMFSCSFFFHLHIEGLAWFLSAAFNVYGCKSTRATSSFVYSLVLVGGFFLILCKYLEYFRAAAAAVP